MGFSQDAVAVVALLEVCGVWSVCDYSYIRDPCGRTHRHSAPLGHTDLEPGTLFAIPPPIP